MRNALTEAKSLGLDCVQVFTKNQQQWEAPPLRDDAVADWKAGLAELGWSRRAHTPARTVSHASYLINIASPDPTLREKSLAALREEADRADTLGIPILVFHPGAHTTSTPEEGLDRIAQGVAQLIADTPGGRVCFTFENVAGAGSTLGRTFEQLATLRNGVLARAGQAAAPRVGFCIDTCHAHAAGYDLSTTDSARRALDQLDRACGLENVRALHLNDSKGPANSRLDRHEHIGRGTIGFPGFAVFAGCPAFASIPKVMETPKGDFATGRPWDAVNVALLRALASGQTPTLEPPAPSTTPSRTTASAKPTMPPAKAPPRTKPKPPPKRKPAPKPKPRKKA
jgi:deoxyribonuclease-4